MRRLSKTSQPGSGPLTDDDYVEIQRQLQSVQAKIIECDRATEAGCNVEPIRQQLAHIKESLEAKKRVYWPDRP